MLSLNALIFQCRDPAISHRDDDNLRLFFLEKNRTNIPLRQLIILRVAIHSYTTQPALTLNNKTSELPGWLKRCPIFASILILQRCHTIN
jgi:hypothetical protein